MKKVVSISVILVMMIATVVAFAGCSVDEQGNLGMTNKAKSPDPTNISIKDGCIAWEFANASNIVALPKVTVECNGIKITSKANAKSVSIENIITKTGVYEFSLVSKSGWLDGFSYEDSNVVIASFNIEVLDKPGNIEYKAQTNELSWDAVLHANKYIVKVNDEVIEVAEPRVRLYNYQGLQKVTVIAKGNGSTIFNSIHNDVTALNYLYAPKNITYSSKTISWQGDKNATKYEIYNKGEKIGESNTSSFELNNLGVGESNICVKAIGDGVKFYDSPMSASFKITIQG